MAFPATPRVIKGELFVSGSWVDISSDVYVRGGITISRGRKDEQSRAEPSSCSLVIDNRSGNYSPRNPVGIWYGSLGRNTPLRLSIELGSDTFTRTVSSGWGTTDTGQAWSITGAGGAVSGTNFNVAAGVGTVLVPAVSSYRYSWLATTNYRDVDVAVTVTLPFTTVTGGAVEPANILLRGQSFTDYYMIRPSISTAGAITIAVLHPDGSTIAAAVSTGLTHSSSQALRVRAQVEGSTIRAKIWALASGEPYNWQIIVNTTRISASGWVGIRSGIAAANTNIPVTFSYDDITVRVPRFTGEVAAWPQRWDLSGNDVYVPIQAAGIKRRLGQGAAPLRSAMYRYHAQLATVPVDYWPAEDARNSPDNLLSAVGGLPLLPFASSPGGVPKPGLLLELATYTGILSSGPLAQLGVNPWYDPTLSPNPGVQVSSNLQGYTSTGRIMFRTLVYIPPASNSNVQPTDASTLAVLTTFGTAQSWSILYRTGGALELICVDNLGATVVATGAISFGGDIRGRNILLSLQLTDSGGNVLWSLTTLDAGLLVGLIFSGTLVARTAGQAQFVSLGFSPDFPHTPIGHISVRKETTNISEIATQLSGYLNEPGGSRVQRLCSEEGIAFSYRGDLTATQQMGPQGAGAVTTGSISTASLTSQSVSQTLLDLLYECEDVDAGSLYESRGDNALAYRTRASAYSQSPTLTMDYTAGQVAPPLEPIDDDQQTRNNIIVTRVNGASVEAELTVGRLSTLPASTGGVGNYNTQYTLNVASDTMLVDFATWLLSVGTVDEARYPSISINFANPNTVTAGLESNALAVDIDDLIVVTNPKTGVTPDAIRQLVRGYTETINVFTHTIKFNCAPESPYRVAKLEASPLMRVDTATSTLVSGVSSSATSLSVANVNEPWTTDPAEMPIPIFITGELINVTAVTGASSPQTLTVTRSANGIVKAQLAGATVEMYPPSSPSIAL